MNPVLFLWADPGCLDIADTPLETRLAAAPANIMFGLDDSGSMDWEIMTGETDGLFDISGRSYAYVFVDPGDNLFRAGINSYEQQSSGLGHFWKSQWWEHNVLYYNPRTDYIPWSPWLGNVHPDFPRSHPYYPAHPFNLSGTYTRIGQVTVPNAHYYVWSESRSQPYLIVVDKGLISYYAVTGNDDSLGQGNLSYISNPPDDVRTYRSYEGERQNFANWFSYYRKRRFAAVAAISQVIPTLQGMMVGIRSINGHIIQGVVPVGVNGEDQSHTLLEQLFSYHPGSHAIGATPLRSGLEKIGQYFHTRETIRPSEPALSLSPLSLSPGGGCQQNFAVLFTDGAYNGGAPGLGNVDREFGAPFADRAAGTLADVAMYYWKEDLAPAVPDYVPKRTDDIADWQHMVTFTVSFGLTGNLNPADYDLYNVDETKRRYPAWPVPVNSDRDRIDDLWHAAVNGHGLYLNANTPGELLQAFQQIASRVRARAGSAAQVSVNAGELRDGLVLYRALYDTAGWTGDVVACAVDSATGEVNTDTPLWSASRLLDGALNLDDTYWDTGRLIATLDRGGGQHGIPFRFSHFGSAMNAHLPSKALVDYLRGDHSFEVCNGGPYRSRFIAKANGSFARRTVMADVIHSSPLFYKGMVYAGANDGMLHAFCADSGREVFAYVPSLVFDHLANLALPGYTHEYYVDLTPYAGSVLDKDLLVGGLGKGGRGYYCLDITLADRAISTESELADRVLWEFPDSRTRAGDIEDMGYSYGRAFFVETRSEDHPWVAVFGNGYNSPGRDAVLFIVDALTGVLVRKIKTLTCQDCNGLSTPLAVDVLRFDSKGGAEPGSDGFVDYVYAGDLSGQLWKFDLSASDPAEWDVAYKKGSIPTPLFQAQDPSGTVQPITTRPDAMHHCDLHGTIVVMGTGKYLGTSDPADKSIQTLYAVWDYGDDENEYLGSFNRGDPRQLSNQPETVGLLAQTVDHTCEKGGTTYRIFSDHAIHWATQPDYGPLGDDPDPSSLVPNHVGWFWDLPDPGERIIRDVAIRSGKVIVITSVPDTGTPCKAGEGSYILELDACTGARTITPQIDINEDGIIDDDDQLTITYGNKTVTAPPTGIRCAAMMDSPVIVKQPEKGTEIKYLSTSNGSVVILRETEEDTGMTFWRHREK